MRNGNDTTISTFQYSTTRSYRTYEEWKLHWIKIFLILLYSSYRTYEEWKLTKSINSSEGLPVLTVPMRNGNTDKRKSFSHSGNVLTVPMRNGNYQNRNTNHWIFFRSYRTYEEWKQYSFRYNFQAFMVLTVPMRNGNFDKGKGVTDKEKVLTVPMRNGN